MDDAYLTSNGSRSVRPSACTRLMRYMPGLRAAAVAISLVSKAVFPSFHVMEIGQNVASLKYPVFVRLAMVCILLLPSFTFCLLSLRLMSFSTKRKFKIDKKKVFCG